MTTGHCAEPWPKAFASPAFAESSWPLRRTLRVPRPDSAEPVKRHRPRPRENPRPGGLALAGSASLLDAAIFSLSSAIRSGQAV